ncbi:MAG TPA: hypothetical protein VMU19_03305 [Bryobacteraceae bacterium]|nr:hypothetical protein [Bryobacteraceae bacterium]
MRKALRHALPAACLSWWTFALQAQPLAKPLLEFDKLVSELKSSSVVGEPIHEGETTVVPFAAVQFGLGSLGAMGVGAGSLGAQSVPLGVVIVTGDDVRVESMPEPAPQQPGMMRQLIQGIIDKKVSFMVNGLNIGNAPGTAADLAPMISELAGHTTVMVNGLNLGNMQTPRPPAAADSAKSVADLEAAARKSPTAENFFKLGEALRKSGQKDKATAAYRKAVELRPGYAEAAKALAELKQ